jgi:hypothetical protein
MIYELETRYDSRKSFYGKAKVEVTSDRITLISYTTKVAFINKTNNTCTLNGVYSRTTIRHIKEFLKQQGFDYKEALDMINRPPALELPRDDMVSGLQNYEE